MTKFFVILTVIIVLISAGCASINRQAFGIHWETAGPADVAEIDVDARGEFGENPVTLGGT